MASLDFKANASIYMESMSLVGFGTVEEANATAWSFLTSTGTDLDFQGQDMTFDAQGRALSGTVSSIAIDVGNNNANNPDLVITGINVAATTLDDGPGSFWQFLHDNDVITLPSAVGNGGPSFGLFGDGIGTAGGYVAGGDDAIHVKAAAAYVSGDVRTVELADFHGGADKIDGLATNALQTLFGDAVYVGAAKLTGGSDNILIQSASSGSLAVGDAEVVGGTSSRRGEVGGGNDYIAAGVGSYATLVGDVNRQLDNSFVRGGIDELAGNEKGELIVGDVRDVGINRLTGGDDTIWGNGGSDILIGDAYAVAAGGRVVGGDDIIYGGQGSDQIFGDTANGSLTNVIGGNDELHGDAGDDLLAGGSGDDVLDGGIGNDTLIGALGNDVYVVDSAGDTIVELGGEGVDVVKVLIGNVTIADNVENLSSVWIGDFAAGGNGLNNAMSAGGGDDVLDGKAGNDVLIGLSGDDLLVGSEGNDVLLGGAGADTLVGGDGIDTASYEGATQGVRVALDASLAALGDALGDTLFSIERLGGSDYRDVLRGNAGANVLSGGAGNDTLQGGEGNDVIIGGAGRDALLGGAGDDRFDFLALTDGGDTIQDFGAVALNNDALRFDGDVFGGLADGALAANRFVANAAGVATTVDQRFVYETDTGILRYDANGSAAGGVTAIATFTGELALSAGDFFII
jgi:Ca2+-binding RTX toxin-like protein